MSIEQIRTYFSESNKVKDKILNDSEILALLNQITSAVVECFRSGKKLLFCGNGGSCSDSIHLAAECLVRLRGSINRQPLPAIALAVDQGALTAYANDFGIEGYFENMVSVLGAPGDILFCLSTSGKSPNIVRAAKMARSKGITVVGFLGCGGGVIGPICDHAYIVPSDITSHIQEAHITAGHAILLAAEDQLLAEGVIGMRTHS